MAAANNRVCLVELLARAGAVLDQADDEGDTALFDAIYRDAADAAIRLLQLGVDRQCRNKKGQLVLHTVALFARVGTIQALERVSGLLTGLDTKLEDAEGKTPMQLCLERESEAAAANGRDDTELSQAFARLLAAIEASGSDEEDEFVDASELPLDALYKAR